MDEDTQFRWTVGALVMLALGWYVLVALLAYAPKH